MSNSRTYRHLFFDLDRTLWDFERNSEEVLRELYECYGLKGRGVDSFDGFLASYRSINEAFWKEHRAGKVGKDELRYERFHQTLIRNGVSDRDLADRLAEAYIWETPRKLGLIEGALETLAELAPFYRIHLLTNGYADTQFQKCKGTGLEAYMDLIVTSDRAGVRKPDPAFFLYALEALGIDKSEALMIGDDVEADIIGARDVGIDQVLFDPHGHNSHIEASYRIGTLKELLKILLVKAEEGP